MFSVISPVNGLEKVSVGFNGHQGSDCYGERMGGFQMCMHLVNQKNSRYPLSDLQFRSAVKRMHI